MREILFRGKRVDNGEWVEGAPFQTHDTCKMIYAIALHPDFEEENDTVYYSEAKLVDPSTVGQYTGLKDKNGKRVFEGDVLKCWYEDDPDDFYVTPVFAYGNTLCVDVRNDDCNFSAIDFAAGDWNDAGVIFEVIGNIRDNPELL